MAPYFYCLPVCAGCGIIVLNETNVKAKIGGETGVRTFRQTETTLCRRGAGAAGGLGLPHPATRRDISEKLTATGWAPATVLNFLYRLEEKGWVKGGKAGSQNTYLPTVTRRAYCVAAMRQRMDTLFGGSLPEAVRALASESGASQSQLEQAIRVLEEQHQEAEEYDLYDPYG